MSESIFVYNGTTCIGTVVTGTDASCVYVQSPAKIDTEIIKTGDKADFKWKISPFVAKFAKNEASKNIAVVFAFPKSLIAMSQSDSSILYSDIVKAYREVTGES